MTNVSFLLYLTDVPEDEGGETDFISDVTDEESVVFSVRPTRGAVVVFPHDQPRVGRCVKLSRSSQILSNLDPEPNMGCKKVTQAY